MENPILAVPPPATPLIHVTIEATTAVISSVDSSTSSPATLAILVTVAVAVIFPSTSVLVASAPSPLAVDNWSDLLMYSALLQATAMTRQLDGPLTVQVKMTSSPGQVLFPSRSVLVNSWYDTQTAVAKYMRSVSFIFGRAQCKIIIIKFGSWPSALKRMRKRGPVILCTMNCPKLWNVVQPIRSFHLQLTFNFIKNAAWMYHMVAFESRRALWRLQAGKRHRVSPVITSPWY